MADLRLQRSVGDNIRSARIARNMSQGGVALAIGISVPALSKIENGQTDINLSRLAQLAKLFKLPVAALINKEAAMADASVLVHLEQLKTTLADKELEISSLQKKVIQLYEKLGL